MSISSFFLSVFLSVLSFSYSLPLFFFQKQLTRNLFDRSSLISILLSLLPLWLLLLLSFLLKCTILFVFSHFFVNATNPCVFFLLVRTCVSYILCLCPVVYVSSFKIKVSALHIYFYSFKADVSVSSLVSFIDRWKGSSFLYCVYIFHAYHTIQSL